MPDITWQAELFRVEDGVYREMESEFLCTFAQTLAE